MKKFVWTICLVIISGFILLSCIVQGEHYREIEEDLSCINDDDCVFEDSCQDGFCAPAQGCILCSSLSHAEPVCFHGLCMVQNCESGWHNANGLYQDGCEYECDYTGGGIEVCDSVDNDCDNNIDEDFNFNTDPDHCGYCNYKCPTPDNAEPLCALGECNFICIDGYYDVDGIPDNGCESDLCEPTAGGVEICDLRDNDCDGYVDEDIDKTTVSSCGPLCEECSYTNAESFCVDGVCVMGVCDTTCQDLNGDPSDGCEYCCVPTGNEICDEIDNDCNGLIDEGIVCSCPADMTLIDSLFCIDIYEASRPDATFYSAGALDSTPLSVSGVVPWTNTTLQIAADACNAAGKRLCTAVEWETVCHGPTNTVYSYGDQYDPEVCNGIDTFCRCEEGSVCENEDPCPYTHCYHTCGAWFGIEPTGVFPNCTNGYGIFDITGNAWERVQGGAGRGGAYNCSNSENLHQCTYEANWGAQPIPNFGFRCCCSGTSCPISTKRSHK